MQCRRHTNALSSAATLPLDRRLAKSSTPSTSNCLVWGLPFPHGSREQRDSRRTCQQPLGAGATLGKLLAVRLRKVPRSERQAHAECRECERGCASADGVVEAFARFGFQTTLAPPLPTKWDLWKPLSWTLPFFQAFANPCETCPRPAGPEAIVCVHAEAKQLRNCQSVTNALRTQQWRQPIAFHIAL